MVATMRVRRDGAERGDSLGRVIRTTLHQGQGGDNSGWTPALLSTDVSQGSELWGDAPHLRGNAAELLVRCLEQEGVTCVFGLPGEENIHFTEAISRSSIRYVLVRHEQAASFMAEIYGRLTGQAGVCSATLGPGAINLLLGVADATTNSTPLVAISAQVGLNRMYKESHQSVDLVSMFAPVTKWADLVLSAPAIPEMIRKAFKLAQTERPGAVYLAVPEDVEKESVPSGLVPLAINVPRADEPSPTQIARAAALLETARRPVVLAGHGAARSGAAEALRRFSDTLGLPVATTFHGKGVFPDDHPNALGAVGFMRHDYVNFGFDEADVLITVGYELQEFDPVRINPRGDKRIVHLSRFPAEVDSHYDVDVGVQADLGRTLDALAAATVRRWEPSASGEKIRRLLAEELSGASDDDSFPLKPQRIVADIRAALGRDDIVLADTGAVKMWMARLYPTYEPNTCLISNGLSTMAFSLPGAIGAKIAVPERRVLAAVGDGAFLMNSQEIETALRERVPITILIWQDDAYGLIKWKMDLELGHAMSVGFDNPDFVAYAESFGARGYRITSAAELLPTLREALDAETVSVIACPVDYRENLRLTDSLGELTGPF
jgi:acetolactate synthase-1/2/3 large subunit